MFSKIDQEWANQNTVLRPISTGDLGQSLEQLSHLIRLPGIKGLLAVSSYHRAVYIPVPSSATAEKRKKIVRFIFSLAAIGGLFSNVQAIKNEADLPKDHILSEAYQHPFNSVIPPIKEYM